MSDPNRKRVVTAETSFLSGQDMANVNSADSSRGTLVTSEEIARQIRTMTNPLSMQMKKVPRDSPRHNKENSCLV